MEQCNAVKIRYQARIFKKVIALPARWYVIYRSHNWRFLSFTSVSATGCESFLLSYFWNVALFWKLFKKGFKRRIALQKRFVTFWAIELSAMLGLTNRMKPKAIKIWVASLRPWTFTFHPKLTSRYSFYSLWAGFSIRSIIVLMPRF